LAEVRERAPGRLVARVRLAGADAVALELAGERHELWLDAAPGSAGAYLLTRAERRAIPVGEATRGPAHQALLHLRKRLAGERVVSIDRIPGERALLLVAGPAVLALRLWGPAPCLTLAVDGTARASLGAGPSAWPPPAPAPEREWTSVDAARMDAALRDATPARAVLATCPGLGPDLARALAEGAVSWSALKERLAMPEPTLVLPGPLESLRDADLAAAGAVALLPAPLPGLEGTIVRMASWREGSATFLSLRRRGALFRARLATAVDEVRREARRLRTLEERLGRDLAGLPSPEALRRQAEALLASVGSIVPASGEVEVPDPYQPGARVRIRVDPRLSAPANADRIFEKARRLERAGRQVETRRADTRDRLRAASAREARVLAARDLDELDGGDVASAARPKERASAGGARHYLTARGLSVLVGRGARENRRLTFGVAGPEDLWLHARDVPGAHVILRDPEGRAAAEDIREAAELAAFFSDARSQVQADVHVTRRKHVRAARGGRGRVRVVHSDTLRVAPRDPEGRLRRRL
jgi:NFACT N-terminal and middle domains/NFACT protein RNA binding domain